MSQKIIKLHYSPKGLQLNFIILYDINVISYLIKNLIMIFQKITVFVMDHAMKGFPSKRINYMKSVTYLSSYSFTTYN